MKDFICVVSRSKLVAGLRKLGLKNAEGKLDLGLPTLDSPNFVEDGKTFHFSLVRCIEPEDKARLTDLANIPSLKVIGEVVGDEFVWSDEQGQDLYERCLEVGKYRKMVPVLDKNGNFQVDSDMELVKVKSSHPYRFGAFC